VAVIDSGVDPHQPLLRDVLLSGFDFTRNVPGASEWETSTNPRRPSSTGPVPHVFAGVTGEEGKVVQSTAAILDSACVPGRLTQSTAAILDTGTETRLAGAPPLPPAFGHGTIVAGLIHAVAPRAAHSSPEGVLTSDGTGRSADIAQAIYYAVLKGPASSTSASPSRTSPRKSCTRPLSRPSTDASWLQAAATKASSSALAGGARLGRGCRSDHALESRAPFSNPGLRTFKVGAPGVDLVSTFPGGYYAAVSGPRSARRW
jgi:hypothetical protein